MCTLFDVINGLKNFAVSRSFTLPRFIVLRAIWRIIRWSTSCLPREWTNCIHVEFTLFLFVFANEKWQSKWNTTRFGNDYGWTFGISIRAYWKSCSSRQYKWKFVIVWQILNSLHIYISLFWLNQCPDQIFIVFMLPWIGGKFSFSHVFLNLYDIIVCLNFASN